MKIPLFTSRKRTLLILSIAVLVAAGLIILELRGTINLVGAKHPVDNTSKTTSDAASAQSDFKADAGDTKKPSQSSQQDEALVSDTGGGQTAQNSNPLNSRDGVISVYSPVDNSLFTSGSSLTGKATVSKVSYRLMDDVSGVTATGDLNVVNGSFSGKFSFSTKATQGRLDVFYTGNGGVEQSIIEIPVRFR